MADEKKVVFKYGSRADYDALGSNKNEETLYFLLDTGEIRRGEVNLARGHHYEAEVQEVETESVGWARALGGKTAVQDDICILKTLIHDDGTNKKYSRTAYVYDNGWKAMDGNYNAENVYFDQDLTFTKEIGYVTLTNGKGTLQAAGKNMKLNLLKLLVHIIVS